MISTKRSPDPGEERRPLNQSSIAMSTTSINSPDYLDSQGRDTGYSREYEPKISFSVVSKDHGNLTKIMRMEQSKLVKDSSACSMSSGSIKTVECTIPKFAEGIRKLKPNEALVHGISEFPEARVVVKGKYEDAIKKSPGNKPVISRTKDHLHYSIGPCLLMLDHDEPRPNAVAAYDKALKSYSPKVLIDILAEIHPDIAEAAFVSTPSTSSCIYGRDGNELRGEGAGAHVYLFVRNGEDIPRYLMALGEHLTVAGFGRIEISQSGALLHRTIVDLSVGSPERLDFVAGAVCEDGLVQKLPQPKYYPGKLLNTSTLGSLTSSEEFKALEDARSELKELAKPGQKKTKAEYVGQETKELVKKVGIAPDKARIMIISRQSGILKDDDVLFFSHLNGHFITVGTVLNTGAQYDHKSLADPLEPDYDGGSTTKAKFYWNKGINPIIHSFCHGSIKYTFERFEDGPEWSFDDAETVLVNSENCSNSSKDRMDLANDILQHSSFEAFEIDIIRDLIKKHLQLNKGAQDKVIKELKFNEYAEDEDTPDPTHWEIAQIYIEDNLPNYPQVVGAEGALWVFSPKSGLYEEFPLTKVEDLVGQNFCGNNCKKGADYKSIARIVYNKLFQKDFFGDAPYGIAALSQFILIDKGGSIRTELYRPDHRQRYKLSVDPYKLDAPLFFKYLEDTFTGEGFEQNIALLQEIMGGLVIGCFNKLQRAVLLLGSGSNGKSVLLELLENMFPPGLKSAVSPNDFDGEYYRAELAGKVVNIVGELDKTKFLRSVFKDVIGCDTSISARLPYKDPFSFKPTAAHIFALNHFPPTKDHSHGFYRR